MRPRIGLTGSILRANVRAYAALGTPVAAVVKSDGYGWGAARVAREVDDVVESYIVADEAEFWALRMCTRRPIRLLSVVAPQRLAELCANGAIPNVTTRDGVEAVAAYNAAADRPTAVRIGIIDAAGWSGIAAADAGAFGALCAQRGIAAELWTHVTSAQRRDGLLRTFHAAVDAFRAAHADVGGIDVASTAGATVERGTSRLRVGAGLFGVRLGGKVATACAIRVDAPLVEWFPPGAVGWAGYGDVRIPAHRGVAVLRCGYGDGLPKKLAGDDDILSVGMQYTTRLSDNAMREHALIDETTDLDGLADRLGVGPHEIITGLAQHT